MTINVCYSSRPFVSVLATPIWLLADNERVEGILLTSYD